MSKIWKAPFVRIWREGLNARRTINTGITAWVLVMGMVCSFLLVGCACNDDGVGPKPPVQEYTYEWKIDTLVFDLPGLRPPDRFVVKSIWGSSSHDVWAVSPSDVPWGELWHYDGERWRAVEWPWIGTDEIGLYGGYLSSVSGFDSSNVFFFGTHGYLDTPAHASVIKWNGNAWSELPWLNGERATGGLTWGVKQNNNKLWAISTTGLVSKYDHGVLISESKVTDYRLSSPVIAALDNGEVYLNPYQDSIENGNLKGSITKLFKRDIGGQWSMIEDKFIHGDLYDNNGLGRGLHSIGNSLFSGNYGLWERIDSGWVKRMSIYGIGGVCLVSVEDIWVYFSSELWHQENSEWKRLTINVLANYPDYYLYGDGWSDGQEIFIGLTDLGKSYVLHGIKIKK